MYVLRPVKWNGEPDGTPGGNVTWTYDSTVPPSFENDLQGAFAWSQYGDITFTEVAPGAAANIVFTYGPKDGPGGVAGEATTSSSSGRITSVRILIDNAEGWTEDANGVATSSYSNVRLSTVALHEVGHGIGMDHDTTSGSIMSPVADPNINTLQQDDIQGVQAKYGQAVCFCAGTSIATIEGDVLVEQLAIGDLVITTDGEVRSVTWVGHQSVVSAFAEPIRSYPIRIRAGAIAEHVPAHDLFLSPDHALLIEGVLVQAGALVNGTTVARVESPEAVFTYYHVETEDHAIIFAEGAPAETFVSNVTRRTFDNYAEYEALFGARADFEAMVERDEPRAMSARQVPAKIKARLAARAAVLDDAVA